jgi:oligopeptidase B
VPALPRPPAAERRPRTAVLHGDLREDPYFWLRDREDPAVREYLAAENAYADAVLADTVPLREQLYHEMLGRIKQTDVTAPYRDGPFFYYTRTEEGKQYPIHCRRADTSGAPEEILLDLNTMAEGKPYLALGEFSPTDDGSLLAFSTDETGFREYLLQVKDLVTGALLPFRVKKSGTAAWAADGRTLFYTVEDQAKRASRLYRQVLGTDQAELVYEEPDERFRIAVGRTRSRALLVLSINSHTTSEVRLLDAGTPGGTFRLVAPRVHDREYDLDHQGGRLLIRVNDTGRTFRLVAAPLEDPSPERWVEVLAARDDVMLEAVDCFAGHAVVTERTGGLPRFRVIVSATGETHLIPFPEPVCDAAPGPNRVFNATLFRYHYQSLVRPASVFDYDMAARTTELRKQTEVLGGFDPSHYRSERLEARAADGTLIPVSIVYRADRPRDGGPLLLHGYGAYGIPFPIAFSSSRLSLLDRGVAVAIAHVRGGGELGKPWHDQGRMGNKGQTFTDFIAVAEHLVRERWTAPESLVAEGGSAGGLLIGAVANLRPDLFRAMVSLVPFVDVVNTMSDPTLPLTVGEYEEWGNPAVSEEYRWIRSYCPYTNLRAGEYPAMLVRTSFHDSQVMYWEPAKYVARLRTLKTDDRPLLLMTNLGAGHGGASGRYDHLREIALDYAFLLRAL